MIYVVFILCGIIAFEKILHHIERQDLYNRIMSKSLSEYKSTPYKSRGQAHKRVLARWREPRYHGGDEIT